MKNSQFEAYPHFKLSQVRRFANQLEKLGGTDITALVSDENPDIFGLRAKVFVGWTDDFQAIRQYRNFFNTRDVSHYRRMFADSMPRAN